MTIKISTNASPDIDQLNELFKQAGWHDKTDKERLKSMIDNSTIIVTAWDSNKMTGFARCLTDFSFNGQINNVVVDNNYRGSGIGKQLIEEILNSSEHVTYILRGDPDNAKFYYSIGFENEEMVLVYRRKS